MVVPFAVPIFAVTATVLANSPEKNGLWKKSSVDLDGRDEFWDLRGAKSRKFLSFQEYLL